MWDSASVYRWVEKASVEDRGSKASPCSPPRTAPHDLQWWKLRLTRRGRRGEEQTQGSPVGLACPLPGRWPSGHSSPTLPLPTPGCGGVPLRCPLTPCTTPQEVSAFGEAGEGDELDLWTVRCSGEHWERGSAVRFQHVGTSVFLSVTGEQYGNPIRGQLEVHGMSSANTHNTWKAMEGIFIKPGPEPSGGHDEL